MPAVTIKRSYHTIWCNLLGQNLEPNLAFSNPLVVVFPAGNSRLAPITIITTAAGASRDLDHHHRLDHHHTRTQELMHLFQKKPDAREQARETKREIRHSEVS